MRKLRSAAAAAAALLLSLAAACTLPDEPLGPGDDVLVVEAVLRTDAVVQEILLHRTVGGGMPPEPGARVKVTTASGRAIEFTADGDICFAAGPVDADGDPRPGGTCYRSSHDEGRWVEPGETYELTVGTSRGERLRGRTVVPEAFALVGMPHASGAETPQACAIPAGTVRPIRWTQSRGAWAYVAPLRIHGLRAALAPGGIDAPEPLDLVGLAVTAADTSILLPSEFGVFDRFRLDQDLLRALQGGLPPGVTLDLAIAAADRNYVNGVRGGSFNPSGQVRISSIAGDGMGVFGSLVPLHARIVVDPPGGGVPPCPAG